MDGGDSRVKGGLAWGQSLKRLVAVRQISDRVECLSDTGHRRSDFIDEDIDLQSPHLGGQLTTQPFDAAPGPL